MVPDMKNLLAQKIRAVEQEPVTWNKADVWSRVTGTVSPRHRSYRHAYYVAATLLIASLALLPLLNKKPVASSSSVHHSLSTTPVSERQTDSPQSPSAEPAAPSGITTVSIPSSGSMQKPTAVTESGRDTLASPELPGQESTMPGLAVTNEVLLVNDKPEAVAGVSEETVKPIIGTIDTATRTIAIHEKRKRLIRKLETSDTAEADAALTTILLARNK